VKFFNNFVKKSKGIPDGAKIDLSLFNSTLYAETMEQIILAQFSRQKTSLDFHFWGQKALKFSSKPVLVGFLQIQVSTPGH